jgi:hypothetical protein
MLKPLITASRSLLSSIFAFVRPYTPRVVPLLVCATFFPLVILVSLGAGYFVWSNLSISWQLPLYLQYGCALCKIVKLKPPLTHFRDGVPPYAHVELPRMMSQQRYAISVELQLPATETNLALGNFMTSLMVLSSNNKTLAYVRRPVCDIPFWILELNHQFWFKRQWL